MTDAFQANRRRALAQLSALSAATLSPWALRQALAQTPLTMGVIYVGPRDDFGYNQAQAEAAAQAKKLPGVKVVEEENVPETAAVTKTMTGMIKQDGAKLLFPTSYGYFDPYMLALAAKEPDVRFSHCGGLWTEGKHPKNTGSYFGYIDECQYLNGVIAGHMTKSKKLGFVAAKPIPQVLRNINAFTLGARSVDPSITTTVIFTGAWNELLLALVLITSDSQRTAPLALNYLITSDTLPWGPLMAGAVVIWGLGFASTNSMQQVRLVSAAPALA